MPSIRHSLAMLCSPREPSSTMRIFPSVPLLRRVSRRISLTVFFYTTGFISFIRVFTCHLRSFVITMTQKHSLRQYTELVQLVLTDYNRNPKVPIINRAVLPIAIRVINEGLLNILISYRFKFSLILAVIIALMRIISPDLPQKLQFHCV